MRSNRNPNLLSHNSHSQNQESEPLEKKKKGNCFGVYIMVFGISYGVFMLYIDNTPLKLKKGFNPSNLNISLSLTSQTPHSKCKNITILN